MVSESGSTEPTTVESISSRFDLRLGANLYYFWEKKWFFIALLVGFVLLSFDPPEGLTRAGQIVLTMSIMATILFVTEPIPLPGVALLIIIGEVLLMGLESTEVAKSLMNDSVLFIMGSLMLAVAVVRQRLDKRIAWLIVRMTGTKTTRVCFGISIVSGVLASFIGEHTVAAMMLPVGILLVTLTSDDPKEVRSLAAVILFSISYGCSVAGIGTPSGGARNAIMIGYWKEFFYDPTNPETFVYLMDYAKWMLYAYPMFLIQVPIVTFILFVTFRPEHRDLSRAIVRLRAQVAEEGPMKAGEWVSIGLFFLVLLGWILFSQDLGMGTVAVSGAVAFLIAGLVRWEDINNGVNWGVVLLYAAAISLGVQMKDTGGRRLGRAILPGCFGAHRRRRRDRTLGGRIRAHDGHHQHDVQRRGRRRARADRPQHGRSRRREPDRRRVRLRGVLRFRLPDRGRNPRLYDRLLLGIPQDDRFSRCRLENGNRIHDNHVDGGSRVLASGRHLTAEPGGMR